MSQKRIRTQAHRDADRRYAHNKMIFSISYTPSDRADGLRLKQYLKDTNKSANAFIKRLICDELNRVNYPYPDSDN